MAHIFKKNKIKEIVAEIKSEDLMDKIEIVKRWHDDYHNGSLKSDKETSREQAFNQDFFVKILGYEEKPAKEYSLEPKATTEKGQLPDAVLGFFNPEKEIKHLSAVVELKSASISLDKPQQREGNMSPIQQAFKYKTQYRSCPFVLVTNFWEFRLFQDNQLDYEIWNLDDLVNPENDYFQFKKFWYLLNKENFTTPEGQTKTQRLLSEIRSEQEGISKKFYQEYKNLRLDLLRDLYRQNEIVRNDIEVGIKKAQKIIDRIVFVCFCEDRGLLPENTLLKVLKLSEDTFGSFRTTLQGLFEGINSGSEKLEIPDGYDGGLFEKDSALNDLQISDDVLKNLAKLGKYNFEEDLSVTILGHIFEQSITDLEEIKEKASKENKLPTRQTSQRKKHGIFYTPDYIVDYIVENSLGALLREKEDELKKKYKLKDDIQDVNYQKRSKQVYTDYQAFLQNVKVLDPACGSGAFLVRVVDYLIEENKRVDYILGGTLLSGDEYVKSVLTNNIFGVDLNSESVEITKLSLWLKTAKKGRRLTHLDNNIKCGNSIIDDPEVAGEKAFDWNKEFPEIMSSGGFDVVLGNPPYTYRNAIDSEEKAYFKNNYLSAEGNFDLYKLFMEKTAVLTRLGGYSSFIVPNTFLSAKTYKKLRNLLLSKFKINELFDLGLGIFENVVVESIIYSLQRENSAENDKTRIKVNRDRGRNINDVQEEYSIDLLEFGGEDQTFSIYVSDRVAPIIKKLQADSFELAEICYCTVGINTGYIKDELTANSQVDGRYHKMLSGKDIGRNYCDWKGEWIMYDPDFVKSKGKKGRTLPPEHIFTNDKILVQRTRRGMRRKLVCYLDRDKHYNLNRLSNVVTVDSNFDLRYVCAVLNSLLMDYFFNVFFNEYEVKPAHLSQLPIKKATAKQQRTFAKKLDEITLLNSQHRAKIKTFLGRLRDSFEINNPSRKMSEFFKHDFKSLTSELRKKRKKMSLSEQDEWEQYFKQYKDEIAVLQLEITALDKDIDRMVYDLYQITPSEVELIERYYG